MHLHTILTTIYGDKDWEYGIFLRFFWNKGALPPPPSL
jgi:hypothetical protein